MHVPMLQQEKISNSLKLRAFTSQQYFGMVPACTNYHFEIIIIFARHALSRGEMTGCLCRAMSFFPLTLVQRESPKARSLPYEE